MKMVFENHTFATTRCAEFIDLTDDVSETVEKSQVQNGMALVYSPHTTCAVIINEREEGFIRDFEDLIHGLVPADRDYRHDDMAVRAVGMPAGLNEF